MSQQNHVRKIEEAKSKHVPQTLASAVKEPKTRGKRELKEDPVEVVEKTLDDPELGTVHYNIYKVQISGVSKAFKSHKEALRNWREAKKAETGKFRLELEEERIERAMTKFGKALEKVIERTKNITGNVMIDTARAMFDLIEKEEKK